MTTSKPLQVGIVGAGTAGLSAAIAFARNGHQVRVFEKHPSLAPLGAGLLIQPQGFRALRALGVGERFEAISVPIRRLLGESHWGWRVVDIGYDPQQIARSVSRDNLARMLYGEALRCGVNVAFGQTIHQVVPAGEKAQILTSAEVQTFDLAVLADGAASTLRASAGLAAPATPYAWGALWGQFWVKDWAACEELRQKYRGPREMMGLMPTEINESGVRLSLFWSIRRDRYQGWRDEPIAEWQHKALALWPESQAVVSQVLSHEDLAFAVYRHSWPRRLSNGAVVTAGDSCHSMSPQLGLGTTLAVQDALALAAGVEANGPREGIAEYERTRKAPVRAYQTLSRALTPCFQSDGWAWPRDVLFTAGRYVPGIAWVMKRSVAY